MSAASVRHLGKVASLCCMLCRHKGLATDSPAEIHHPRTGIGAGRRAPDTDGVPLCPIHHRLGMDALHVMGRKAFERHHGVTELDLLEMTRAMML